MRHLILISIFAFGIAGCCSFVPCHPASRIIGHVSSAAGQPIVGATVSLYGRETTTKSNGCFSLNLPDALPFTFHVAANGFKPLSQPARAGYYSITVTLSPQASTTESQGIWQQITENEFINAPSCT